MYGELGRVPIFITSQIRSVNYFNRFASSNCPELTREAFLRSKGIKGPVKTFYNRVVTLLQKHKIKPDKVHLDAAPEVIFEDYLRQWRLDLDNKSDRQGGSSGNKLRFYAKVKHEFTMEPYLYLDLSLRQRMTLSRFRTSCHNLQIELGRHQRPYVPPELRLCTKCNLETPQDEIHHKCPRWASERDIMYTGLSQLVLHFDRRSELELLKILFNSDDRRVLLLLSNYLIKTLS